VFTHKPPALLMAVCLAIYGRLPRHPVLSGKGIARLRIKPAPRAQVGEGQLPPRANSNAPARQPARLRSAGLSRKAG